MKIPLNFLNFEINLVKFSRVSYFEKKNLGISVNMFSKKYCKFQNISKSQKSFVVKLIFSNKKNL